ncbi:putative ribonuclease H-like domain-containing protein [Tanacetum coccineum]
MANYSMSARDKFGLGYGDYRYSGNLSYENEVFQSIFRCNASDFENPPLHKRFFKTCEMQAVPPPMTGNYLPSGPDIEIDDSKYTYGQNKTSTQMNRLPKLMMLIPVTLPLSETSELEYESDSDNDDENVYVKIEDLDTPSFATKHVKTPSENVKHSSTHSQKPKVNNKQMEKGITERACFVCGSFSHLIRDCDYHVKLAKQVELHKQNMSKGNGSREKTNKNLRKPIWDNTLRVNKRQQFVTLAVQTRTGNNPVNTVKASGTNYVSTARQNIKQSTVLTITALPLKGTTVLRTKLTNQKIYIAKVKAVSTVGEKWVIAVKSSASCKWSKPGYNKRKSHMNFLKNKGIIDSGCSRHMTGNKTYLADYQDINGGPVALEGVEDILLGKGILKIEDESAQDCFEVPYWHPYSSTNTSSSKSDEKRRSPREEEQVFLNDLARLQRQEKEANEEAEALIRNHDQDTEKAVTQAEAEKTSSTNVISTVSTTAKASGTNFVNTVSIPVGTASANEGLSLSNTTNSQEDDYEIPPLEDIHEDATDGIFTHASYDDEGAVADFTNLGNKLYSLWKENANGTASGCIGRRKMKEEWLQNKARLVYQMDVKSAFLYGKIDEEVYVSQPPGFQDPKSPQKVYKVVKALYGLHKLKSLDKYVNEILKKFDFANVKSGQTPPKHVQKPLVKDKKQVILLYILYRFMIGSLMFSDCFLDLTLCFQSVLVLGANLDRKSTTEFWTSAKSKTINNARHITAKVAGKLVSISEASIRTDLLFDEANGIDTLQIKLFSLMLIQSYGIRRDLTVLTFNKLVFTPMEVSDQAKEIKLLKAKITKLKRKANPVIKHFKAYQKRISKEQRHQGNILLKEKEGANKSPDPTREKNAKGDDEVSTDEQMKSNDDQVDASEEIFKGTEDQREGIEEKVESTADKKVSTEEQSKEEIASQASQTSSLTPTSVIFGDDETIATLLINMNVKKFKQILRMTKSLLESPRRNGKLKEEKNKIAEEEAANEALIKNFDDVKARIEADRILAEKLQEQEREQFTIEERAKFLHDNN